MYFLNYSNEVQTIKNIAKESTELLSGRKVELGESMTLNPWDVRILEF